jgi:5'-nucleotidase
MKSAKQRCAWGNSSYAARVMSIQAVVLALLIATPALAAPKRTLVFLGTSDQHGHIEQVPLLARYFDDERQRNPGRVVLLDGGDMFQGTLVSNLHEGAAMVHALNAVGYNAVAVGNHEFDYGPVGPHEAPKTPGENARGALQARQGEAHFPFLSANVLDAKTGKTFTKPWVILDVDHVKVGIVGGTAEDTPRTTNPRNLVGLRIAPLGPTVAQAAKEARAAGATVVIAVVHAGGECSQLQTVTETAPADNTKGCQDDADSFRLARYLHDAAARGEGGRVDAIFGGHTHQGVNNVVAGIPILQAYALGNAFSKLELEVDGAGRPTGHFVAHPPELVRKDTVPVAAVSAAIAGDLAEAAGLRAAKIGVTLPLPLRRAYKTESPLGNFAADIIRASTATDVGLTNGGGLRADLPAGELTYGAIFESFPFDNRLATMTLTAAELSELLRRNFSHDKGILSVSGIHVRAHCDGGELAIDLLRVDGKLIAPSTPLKIGTSDFLANGGDDFAPTVAHRNPVFLETEPLRDIIAASLKERLKKGEPELRAAPWFDAAHPRLILPTPKPIICKTTP